MEDDVPEEQLEAFYGDEWPEEAPPGEPRPKAGAGGGRKRTVTGALMAGIAMGFREVFEREQHDRTAIEQPAPEQPTEPQKYEIHLDPIAPEASFAIYRPWLDDPDGEAGPDADRPAAGAPPARPGPAARPKSGGAGALGG